MLNKIKHRLSVNPIIMIVLGVVVLVLLVFGSTMGWKMSGSVVLRGDVDTIEKVCNDACDTQNVYHYCTIKRQVRLDEDVLKTINTDLVNVEKYLELGDRKSCNELLKYPKLRISDCSSICTDAKK